MANKKITYGIDFNVDDSNLQKVRSELNEISKLGKNAIKVNVEGSNLDTLKQSAKELQNAFENAFNPRLNTINIEKFNQSLKNLDIKRIEADFSQLGTKGAAAFRNMTSEILTTQREVRKTSNFIDSMATTLGNTIKWSIASSAINTVTGKIQEAWGYTKKLDQSLNDIRIVTEKSADSMEKFAKSANKAAKNLGTATTNYTKAALIYYQQGLGEQDVQARTQVTVKAANVTGQSASEVSEQLTAVWNGYKVVAEEAELYVDKLAAVAASTAADLEELSTGMSKVASAASTMGVNIDQLSAQLSTIVSVTRQDASLVGTALKTIYARMGDLKVDGVDEFGTTLGDVSGQLKQMGIDVLDQQGNLRDMGNVIEEVAAKWGTWTDAQQQAAAVAIAGKRQYNNLIALFENWDMYESALSTSQNSAGTLQKQQEIYMESLEAKLQKLSTAGEKVFDALFNNEGIGDLIEGLTFVVDKFADLVKIMGGAENILLSLGGAATVIFKKQIASGINTGIENLKIFGKNINRTKAELEITSKFGDVQDEATKKMVALKEKQLNSEKMLTAEQKAQYEYLIKATRETQDQLDAEEAKNEMAKEYVNNWADSVDVSGVEKIDSIPSTKEDKDKMKTSISGIKDFLNNTKESLREGSDSTLREGRKAKQARLASPPDSVQSDEDAKKEGEYNYALYITQTTLENLTKKQGLRGESLKKVQKLLDEAQDDEANLVKIRRELIQVLDEEAKAAEAAGEQLEVGAEKVEKYKNAVKDVDTAAKDFNKSIDTQQLISNLTTSIGAVMSTISAVNMLKNVFAALGDESLSASEKIEQVLMGLGSFAMTTVPMVLNSISMIQKGNEAAGSASQKAWGWIGLILSAITAVTMIVIELVKLIPKQKSALEKAEETAKALKDQANELKESLKETREEYLNLIDAISNYDSAQAAIDKLRAGTDEWKEAILRANLEAQQLAETYEGLELVKEDSKYGVDIFSIDSKSWDVALKNLQDKEAFLQSTFSFISYRSREADMEEEEKKVKEKIGVTYRDEFAVSDLGGSTVFTNLFKDYIAPTEQAKLFAEDFQVYQSYLENSAKSDGNTYADDQLVSDIYNGLTTSDSSTSQFIDDLINVSDETLDLFKQNLEENAKNMSEEQYRTAQKVIETIEAHQKSVDANNAELERLYLEILTNKAKEEGIDEFTFATLGYSEGDLKTVEFGNKDGRSESSGKKVFKDDDDETEYFGRAGFNQFVLPEVDSTTGKYVWETDENGNPKIGTVKIKTIEEGIGSEINTDGDIKAAKNFLDEMVRMAYGPSASVDSYGELDGVSIEDFGSHEIVVKGETITVGQLRNMVTSSIQEQFLEEKNQALIDRQKALASSGQLEETAFFDGEYYDPEKVAKWEGATLGKYDNIIGKSSGTTQANAKTERLKFENEIKGYLNKGDLDTSNLNAFSSLTGSQIKDIANASQAANVFGAGNAVADIINSITDPSQMQKMAELLKDIDWTDSEAVSELQRQMFELGIDIEDEEWKEFFNTVNSGTKEWITNSAKVAEKLDYIKNTISNIKMGDIISDEDYKKITSLDPTKARDFIKTASGWQAIRSGKEISAGMTDRYNSLASIKQGYSQIQSAASSLGAAGVAAGDISQLKTNSQISSFLRNNATNLNAMASAMGIPIPYGSFADAADKLDSVPEEEKSGIKLAIQNTLNQIDQALIDNAEGLFDSQVAEETWATSVATSSRQVRDAFENGDISLETYEKAGQARKSTLLTDFGFTKDIFNNLGAVELEEHLKNIRALELDYFQDINKELDILGQKIELAFGKNKIDLLNQEIETLKEKESRANIRAESAGNSFDLAAKYFIESAVENFGENADFITNGELDISKIIAFRGTLNPYNTEDAEKITQLDTFIGIWENVEDASIEAAEAQQAVIDKQIELYDYQFEMLNNYYDSLKALNELSRGFLVNGATAIEEIQYAIEDFSLESKKAGAILDKLNPFETWADNYSNNIEDYKTASNEVDIFNKWKIDQEKQINDIKNSQARADAIEAEDLFNYEWYQRNYYAGIRYNWSEDKMVDPGAKDRMFKTLTNNLFMDFVDSLNSGQINLDKNDYLDDEKWSDYTTTAGLYLKHGGSQVETEMALKEYLEGIFSESTDDDRARLLQFWQQKGFLEIDYVAAEQSHYTKSQEAKGDWQEAIKAYLKAAEFSPEEYKDGMTYADVDKLIDDRYQTELAQHEYAASEANKKALANQIAANNPFASVDEEGNLIFNEAAMTENWQSWIEQAQSSLETLQAEINNLIQGYVNAQQELMDLYDNQIERLNGINSILSEQANLWKLIEKTVPKEFAQEYANKMGSYYQGIVNNNTKSYDLALQEQATALDEYNKLMAMKTTEAGKDIPEEWANAVINNYQAATEKVISQLNTLIESVNMKFKEELALTFRTFLDDIQDATGLTENWEQVVKKDERYLDEVNEAYAVSELERSMQKSIDETDNISAQNKLMQKRIEIEEELARIKEKQGKLSQYDIDRANALYDITLKQIALEEAQQTANKMKLTRDAMGNYTYQYVQDEDAVAAAEAELAAAKNNLYNMDKDRNKDLVNEYYSLMSEAEQQIADARTANDEKRVRDLQEYYFGTNGLISGVQAELGIASTNLKAMGETLTDGKWSSSIQTFADTISKADTGFLALSNNLTKLVDGSFDALNVTITNPDGTSSEVNALEYLLSESSPLNTAITKLSDSFNSEDSLLISKVEEYQAATLNALTSLPGMIEIEESIRSSINDNYNKYIDWFKTEGINSDNIIDNTNALKELTQVGLRMLDETDGELDGLVKIGNQTYEFKDGLYSIASEED